MLVLLVLLSFGTPQQPLTFLIALDKVLTWVVNETCDANGCADYCQRTKFCKIACESHCCASGVDALEFGRNDIEDDHDDDVDALGGGISARTSCNASKVFYPTSSSSFRADRRNFVEASGNKNVYGVYAAESITIGTEANRFAIVQYGQFGLANIVPDGVLGDSIASGVLGFGFGVKDGMLGEVQLVKRA